MNDTQTAAETAAGNAPQVTQVSTQRPKESDLGYAKRMRASGRFVLYGKNQNSKEWQNTRYVTEELPSAIEMGHRLKFGFYQLVQVVDLDSQILPINIP